MKHRLRLAVFAAMLVIVAGGLSWLWDRQSAPTVLDLSVAELLEDICLVAPSFSYDPASGLVLEAARPIPEHARCPVCGMYPARYPDWAAQLIYRDGAVHYFDSPVSLLAFLRDPARFSNYGVEDVLTSYVNDVPSRRWIRADDAHFVHGSDAMGPMRAGNLPAFADRAAAERFAAERGGIVLGRDEIGPDILNALVTSVHHRH